MSLTAVILVLVSVFTHAGWNWFFKQGRPTPALFLAANTLGGLFLLPVVLLNLKVLAYFTPLVWLLMALSSFCQAFYYFTLARAYSDGDLSVAYPLARAMPVLFTTLMTFLLGKGGQLNLAFLAGAVLVMAGILLLPMRHWTDFSLRKYLAPACLFALLAALGTTGYSMLDDASLHLLRGVEGMPVSPPIFTLVFTFWAAMITSAWLGGYVIFTPAARRELGSVLRGSFWRALGIGAGVYLAYGLVLVAMNYASNVSYVVTFRQLSIPLGAVLGMVVLKEPSPPPKIVGIAVMFAGLVMVGLG
jgi:drug/metabolite transporter (DMT)-like permease